MSALMLWQSDVSEHLERDMSDAQRLEEEHSLYSELIALMLESQEVADFLRANWDKFWDEEARIGFSMFTKSDVIFEVIGRQNNEEEK